LNPGAIPLIEAVLSRLAFMVMNVRRHIIRDELMKSYGYSWDKEKIDNAVMESFRVYVGFHVKNVFLAKLNQSNIERYIPLEGGDYLKSSIERGKGVIVLNPHFGPYLLIVPALGHRGYKVNQLALEGVPPGGRSWLDQTVYDIKYANVQGKMPARFINVVKKSNIRQAVEVLKENEIVLVPSTGRGGLNWVNVRFMNRTAQLNTGGFKLALLTGSIMIPAFVIPEGPFARVILESPFEVREDDMEGSVQRYASLLDSYIEKFPHLFGIFLYQTAIYSKWDHPLFLD